MPPRKSDALRATFLYWGRRGAMPRFGLELLRATLGRSDLSATISIALQNELIEQYRALGVPIDVVDTFDRGIGALGRAWRLPLLRRKLVRGLRSEKCDVVVNLMPHVWTPFVVPAIQAAGIRYATIVHDAARHPGDPSGLVHDWCLREADRSDLVITLSGAVAGQLQQRGLARPGHSLELFHPDMSLGPVPARTPYSGTRPLRLLFFGRILPYKGLGLLLDALDILRQRGVAVQLGVFGDGAIDAHAARLAAMGAEVTNRWLSDAEVAEILPKWDAAALSHIEASQSGVAAVAFAAGLPVIATPVGGLREQVVDGVTGILAAAADPSRFADAVERLARDPSLHQAICQSLAATRDARSMTRFLDLLVARLDGERSQGDRRG